MSRNSAPQDELRDLKAQFLASLSHEMRTPLTGILGMVDLLLETELSEEQKEYAQASQECAQNLLEIMNSTLEFCALSANQIVIEEGEFSLREMLESAVDELAFKAKSKGLDLRTRFDKELPELVVGDALRLKQLLTNLISNAVKFTAQGQVEVAASAVVLEDGDILLSVSVADTGIGIPPEQLNSIFESFQQLESGLSRQYTGLGLGLAVSQKLAHLMHAEVGVQSEVGVGSTFTLHIPMRIPHENPERALNLEGGVINILIVDPGAVSTNVTIQVIDRRPCRVHTVVNGVEALTAAAKTHYDVVVMDLQAPAMGSESIRKIRALPGYSDTSLFLIVANCTLDTHNFCAQHGVQGFIAKPLESSDLGHVLSQHAARQKPLRAVRPELRRIAV